MPYRCRTCRKFFSVNVGTPMQSSEIPLRKWALAIYMISTNLKGVSSMRLHRELGVTQAHGWHMVHRIREAWNLSVPKMEGSVDIDETYIGGKESRKHASKKLRLARGAVSRIAVVGVKDRNTKKVTANVVEKTDRPTLRGFIDDNVKKGSIVYTDEAKAYKGMVDFDHESVKHSVGKYVNDMAHTNGIESFWATFKRGYTGTFHQTSKKHLGRYDNEFVGRHNVRDLDTVAQMADVTRNFRHKTLPYQTLIQ